MVGIPLIVFGGIDLIIHLGDGIMATASGMFGVMDLIISMDGIGRYG